MSIDLNLPRPYQPLFTDHKRYKVYYGGRGSGKSWQFAIALLLLGLKRKIRILCTREIQRSIKESVHKLLVKQIERLELQKYYTIKDKSIVGYNGTEFIFEGLYRNVDSIKSMEGINICWVEEAHAVSENSWNLLIPTIREEGSEIWISFNPDGEDDPVYKRFITNNYPDSVVKFVTWKENPWFPDVLMQELLYDKEYNYSKYLHIWEGEPIKDYSLCVYRFNKDVNVTNEFMTYNEGIETCLSWDFGVSDDTFIIFYQILQVPKCQEFPKGYRINIFDEYCNNNMPAEHYRDYVLSKKYLINAHYCDPSGASRDSSLDSWVSKLTYDSHGRAINHFTYTHGYSTAEMIDNANEWLPFVRINPNQTPLTYAMFRKWMYRTDVDNKLILPPKPLHDKYSHPGTSFYYMIINRFPHEKNVGFELL